MIYKFLLSRKRNNHIASNFVRTILLCLILTIPTIVLISCGSKKPRVVTTKKRQHKISESVISSRDLIAKPVEKPVETNSETEEISSNIQEIAIEKARTFLGTKWKYAGNTKRGIDCSGLICESYKTAGVAVPRTTWTLKEATEQIEVKDVEKGDLLFFATGRNKKRLNHVGLVVNVTPAEIQFIHSSTSKGVIISSLNQPFWLGSYLSAGRLQNLE